jgi:predicted aspartyl protease
VIGDWETEALALLDTDYTGELIVPGSVLPPHIGLPPGFIDVQVGDDRIVETPQYLGNLEISGLTDIFNVSISIIGSEFIVGVGTMKRYKITHDHATRVIIEL